MAFTRTWPFLCVLAMKPYLVRAEEEEVSIQQLNRKYDICVSGPRDDVMEGIENPINDSMQAYVRSMTEDLLRESPRGMCDDLDLCPIPEKWMIPKSNLQDLKRVLKRSTFDVSMEESIKAIPKPRPREPLNISMSVFIESVSSIDDMHKDFDVSLFLVQEWTLDQQRCLNSFKAMAFKGVDVYKRYGNRSSFFEYMSMNYWLAEWPEDQFKLESEHFRLFWIPDVYLSNAKTQFAPFQSIDTRFIDILITSASQHPDMLTTRGTFNECTFRYVWKFNAKISCDLNFLKYPIDVQKCGLQFRSFSYPLTDLVINLIHVESDPGIQLGNQYLTISYKQNNIWPRSQRVLKTIRGLRSLAIVHMTFNRSIGSVFVGVMIPALLVVIIDLTMFWVRIDVISDRIGTGITCLFTLLTQFNATRSALATNSDVTLMDWFMMMCIAFVVLQMTQTIVVYIVYNHEKTRIAELDQRSRDAEKKHQLFIKKNGQAGAGEESPPAAGSRASLTSFPTFSSNSINGKKKNFFSNSSACSDFTTSYKRNMNAKTLSARRRRRIVYPSEFRTSGRHEERSRSSDDLDEDSRSIHDQPQKSLEERLYELRDFLLEPTAKPGSAEYLPMKIDSISRIIIPFLFVFTLITYGLLAASIDERT